MSGRPTVDAVREWSGEVEAVGERIAHHFARSEPWRRPVAYVRALLSETERKHGWQVAEHHTLARPRSTASSTCSPAPTGTPTPSATTCSGTCPSTWARRGG